MEVKSLVGHRNFQGLFLMKKLVYPLNVPMGGDEINLIDLNKLLIKIELWLGLSYLQENITTKKRKQKKIDESCSELPTQIYGAKPVNTLV